MLRLSKQTMPRDRETDTLRRYCERVGGTIYLEVPIGDRVVARGTGPRIREHEGSMVFGLWEKAWSNPGFYAIVATVLSSRSA